MNILFLTTGRLEDIKERGLYTDLVRTLEKQGANVYSVSAYEKRTKNSTERKIEEGVHALRVKTGNVTQCNFIEKGISILCLEGQYKKAIKKYFKDVKFDLVVYTTPPITLTGIIKWIKNRDGARSYLMLKDIFPQNAVDLGILSTKAPKSFIYRYFRCKEKKLYALSDKIGCMSEANLNYVIKHNPEIDSSKVEIFPNCIEVHDMSLSGDERNAMREKYGIPSDRKIFVYGGNLGKPQGIPFVMECLQREKDNPNVFFLIVGSGTEYSKLEAFMREANLSNARLMSRLPKEDYDRMIGACDIGLIFLDYRFTIPNFPSRLLSYMQAKLPVLACTDPNTDIGDVIEKGGFGWQCRSNDVEAFHERVAEIVEQTDITKYKDAAFIYLREHYSVEEKVSIKLLANYKK